MEDELQQILSLIENAQVANGNMAMRFKKDKEYISAFNESTIPLWEVDYTKVIAQLNDYREKGVEDFKEFFDSHLGELIRTLSMVEIVRVNDAVVELMEADSKSSLIAATSKSTSLDVAAFFREVVYAIVDNALAFDYDMQYRSMKGSPLELHMQWRAVHNESRPYARTIVATVDKTQHHA